jgi:hypothetical protein
MTEEAISITDLRHKLDGIASQIPKNLWRFYYIKSISNFIYHLPNFKSGRLTIRNGHDINEYLDHVAQKLTQEHDHRKFARELFPMVWKLANDFKLELGFIARPYYALNFIFWIIIFILLYTSTSTLLAISLTTAFVLFRVIYFQIKIKNRKVY